MRLIWSAVAVIAACADDEHFALLQNRDLAMKAFVNSGRDVQVEDVELLATQLQSSPEALFSRASQNTQVPQLISKMVGMSSASQKQFVTRAMQSPLIKSTFDDLSKAEKDALLIQAVGTDRADAFVNTLQRKKKPPAPTRRRTRRRRRRRRRAVETSAKKKKQKQTRTQTHQMRRRRTPIAKTLLADELAGDAEKACDVALTESQCAALDQNTVGGKFVKFTNASSNNKLPCGCFFVNFSAGGSVAFNKMSDSCTAKAGHRVICADRLTLPVMTQQAACKTPMTKKECQLVVGQFLPNNGRVSKAMLVRDGSKDICGCSWDDETEDLFFNSAKVCAARVDNQLNVCKKKEVRQR